MVFLALRPVLALVNTTLKVPLWAFLVAGLACWIGTKIVAHEARKEMVAVAEVAAVEAERDAAKVLLEFERQKRLREQAAADQFAADLAQADRENESLENEIKDLKAGRSDPARPIGDDLFGRLRNP